MSHDEDQAKQLARFLESGSHDDAVGIDDDVKHAIFALRPDLAPAPRVTVDNILSSVTRGPLAPDDLSATPASLRSREGAEVVMFPGAEESPAAADDASTVHGDASPKSSPPRRGRWAWLGGTSGVGLALAAAATLFLVSRPVIEEAVESPTSVASAPTEEAGKREAEFEPVVEDKQAEPQAAAETKRQRAPVVQRTRKAVPSAPAAEPQTYSYDALELSEAAPEELVARRSVEPQRPTTRQDRYVRSEDLSIGNEANDEGDVAIPEVTTTADDKALPSTELDRLRGLARPNDRVPNAWRADLTPARLANVDSALATADTARKAGDPIRAADEIADLTTRPPARAAQHLAAIAAADYLTGKRPGQAEATIRRALALSQANTPERSQLLYLLGLTLEARGEVQAATDAFAEAERANAGR
ncbi:MAG: hypothetical protein AAGA48_11640 [Myxococcota bacterium]